MTLHSSLRSRLTTSPSLPLWVALGVSVLWILPDVGNIERWGCLGIALVSTILVMEWNNRVSLLRIRSRMTSSTFLLLFALFPQWHNAPLSLLPMVAFLGAYILLFLTYHDHQPEGYFFYALLLISLSSLSYPPLLYLTLPYPLYLLFAFRSFGVRSFFAGLFGILLPYLYWAVYAAYQERIEELLPLWKIAFQPEVPDYSNVSLWEIAAFGFVALLALPATVHFLRTMRMEKQRTLAYFSILFCQTFLLMVCLILQPQAFSILFPLLLLTLSPILAHYYTLAKGRATDIWSVITLALAGILALFNYFDLWTLLSNFS